MQAVIEGPAEKSDAVRYADIAKAITIMMDNMPDESFWVEHAEGVRALEFVSVLQTAKAPPPKIFPHEGGVVFKWNETSVFATLEDDDVVFHSTRDGEKGMVHGTSIPVAATDLILEGIRGL
jgi:hypothetical protein